MADNRTLDPDVTRRDDAPYWAATAVIALRSGDMPRVTEAQQQLARLGVNVRFTTPARKRREAVAHAR